MEDVGKLASPQKENGFTPIANELLEAIFRTDLTGQELKVMLLIMRKSYGFGKKECRLSMSEIGRETGMKKQNAHRIFSRLSSRMMTVVITNDDGKRQGIEINKNYEEWLSRPPKTAVITNDDENVITNDDALPIIKEKKKYIIPNIDKNVIIDDDDLDEEPELKFRKKVPIPKHFKLTPKMIKYADSKNYIGNLKSLTENFKLYYRKKGTKFQDWYAAWQSWLRKDIEFNPDNVEKPMGRAVC